MYCTRNYAEKATDVATVVVSQRTTSSKARIRAVERIQEPYITITVPTYDDGPKINDSRTPS